MPSRSRRITKKQKNMLVNFIETNSEIFKGIAPNANLEDVNLKWREITVILNSHGPPKTVRQWKEAFGELKTKLKKKARDLCKSKGPPTAKKSISELEEHLPKVPKLEIPDDIRMQNQDSSETEVLEDPLIQLQQTETETSHRQNGKTQQNYSILQNIIKDHRTMEGKDESNMIVQELNYLAKAVNNMASAINNLATAMNQKKS